MKQQLKWWFPDGETHLPAWMSSTKGYLVMNGRPSYQGRKQLATLSLCTGQRRRAVDVGGHVGLWSYNLSFVFPHVEAFEPVAAHRDCFEKNVPYQNVRLHPIALGAAPGSVAIFTSPTSSGDSWVKGEGDIPMQTLDSFGWTDVDLLKIDCEGYEEMVLRGARETIAASRPVIVVEQKRDMATKFGFEPLGAVKLLQEAGYTVAKELSGDFLMVPA